VSRAWIVSGLTRVILFLGGHQTLGLFRITKVILLLCMTMMIICWRFEIEYEPKWTGIILSGQAVPWPQSFFEWPTDFYFFPIIDGFIGDQVCFLCGWYDPDLRVVYTSCCPAYWHPLMSYPCNPGQIKVISLGSSSFAENFCTLLSTLSRKPLRGILAVFRVLQVFSAIRVYPFSQLLHELSGEK
jgi:hypothetical protein